MMYMYQSECQQLPYFLSIPDMKRCPFCSELHVSDPEECPVLGQDESLASISNADILQDVLIVNTTPNTSIWFFVYIGMGNTRIYGYANTHDIAVQIALAMGFSGKENRMIDNWGKRGLEPSDFMKLGKEQVQYVNTGT